MVRLVQDSSYREQVAESGFARASSLYRIGKVVDQYENIYQRISRN